MRMLSFAVADCWRLGSTARFIYAEASLIRLLQNSGSLVQNTVPSRKSYSLLVLLNRCFTGCVTL